MLLDSPQQGHGPASERPDMGSLLAIDTPRTLVLAIVSALSVPVPAQRDGEAEIRIAELALVGELWKTEDGQPGKFSRGVTTYPSLGDRARVASKPELEAAFCGDPSRSVRIGCIRQDNSIPAMVRVDELLGKHLAILGTTGTGKSCTTALILRAILEKNPAAHIVLLDPHNEYATAFSEWAEVISPRNMQLPFWLLNFEEIVEVLIGDTSRKAEIEILQELIPIAKARYSAGRARDHQNVRRVDARSDALHRRHAGPLPHLRPHRPHRRAHGQAREQEGSFALPAAAHAHRFHLAGRPLRLHVRLAHRLRRHDAGALAASSACPSTASRSPSSS